jgi:hypothetical protein
MQPGKTTKQRRTALSVAAFAASAFLIAGCGGSGSSAAGSPAQTIQTFLNAAAAGDGATACAQLSPLAQQQVVQGTSCEQGIKLGSGLLGSIIKQIQITGLMTQGKTSTGTATVNGQPMATFQLTKSGGKWTIANEQRTAASGSTSPPAATGTAGPSGARVAAVAQCLGKAFGVESAGSESTGGVAHVVLALDSNRVSAAMVDVFASPTAAKSASAAITTHAAPLTTNLTGSLVIVYLKPVSADKRQQIEACG